MTWYPLNTGHKLNVHQRFNLQPVSRGNGFYISNILKNNCVEWFFKTYYVKFLSAISRSHVESWSTAAQCFNWNPFWIWFCLWYANPLNKDKLLNRVIYQSCRVALPLLVTPWTHDVNWTYIRSSEDVKGFF